MPFEKIALRWANSPETNSPEADSCRNTQKQLSNRTFSGLKRRKTNHWLSHSSDLATANRNGLGFRQFEKIILNNGKSRQKFYTIWSTIRWIRDPNRIQRTHSVTSLRNSRPRLSANISGNCHHSSVFCWTMHTFDIEEHDHSNTVFSFKQWYFRLKFSHRLREEQSNITKGETWYSIFQRPYSYLLLLYGWRYLSPRRTSRFNTASFLWTGR